MLGLYAAAFVGVGFAIGGVLRTGWAAGTVALLTIGTWAIGVLGPALNLPDVLQTLVLSSHYGEPMVGHWDIAGRGRLGHPGSRRRARRRMGLRPPRPALGPRAVGPGSRPHAGGAA